jgi:UDP-N-acetylmuramoyl-tripeptide--D-alanyl-D-alanine ligase
MSYFDRAFLFLHMQIQELYTLFINSKGVQTDTRKIKKGELFFALKGDNFNANTFAQSALNLGADYVIIDEEKYYINDKTIVVENVLICLQELAKYHREQFNQLPNGKKVPFIAITGSNGKTTTKELIHTVLSSTYKTSATIGNLNNHIGVPLTLLAIPLDIDIAIIEMGANHQLEIASYCEYTMPTHAIINNCGKAHLEGFGGIEGVKKGKGELYDYIRKTNGIIFINHDLQYLKEMSIGIENKISYGSSNASITGVTMQHDTLLQVAITTPKLECTIKTQLVGAYNQANVLAAVCIGHFFNISIDKIKKSLEAYTPTNSRSQLIKQGSNTIILDAYNANPTSMKAAILNFKMMDYPNKIVMLGAMKEMGKESDTEHTELVKLLQETNWNNVVLVGKEFKGIEHPYHYFDFSEEAKKWLQDNSIENTAILIKGSRGSAMELVLI